MLFELCPHKPNDLWQMDVTHVHIPGYGGKKGVRSVNKTVTGTSSSTHASGGVTKARNAVRDVLLAVCFFYR